MALRADFIEALRVADKRIAAVPPRPHVEARIRSRMRGEPAPNGSERLLFDHLKHRLRRPALVVLFAACAAIAVIEGTSAPGPARLVPLANSPEATEPGEPDVTPKRDPKAPESSGACDDPSSDACSRRAPPIERHREPASDRPPPDRAAPIQAPRAIDLSTPRYPEDRGRDLSPDGGALPIWPDRWQSPGAPAPSPGPSPTSALPVRSYRVLNAPSDEPQAPPVRALFGPRSGRSEAPTSSGSKPEESKLLPHESASAPDESASAPDESAGCKSPIEWEEIAYAECKEQGLIPIVFTFLDDCGDGTFLKMERTCGNYSPPHKTPSAEVCAAAVIGDGTSCEQPEHWKLLAFDTCLAQGATLMEIYYSADCEEGASSYAKYLCCNGAAPEPEEGACIDVDIGGECTPLDVLEEHAEVKCAAQGLVVGRLTPIKTCEGGDISYATFQCCPAEP